MVRDPAKERTGEAIQDVVDDQRDAKRRRGEEREVDGDVSDLVVLAIGATCAVAMRPPAATQMNMMYMIQKMGVRSTWPGE
jgi:hypothetical protein